MTTWPIPILRDEISRLAERTDTATSAWLASHLAFGHIGDTLESFHLPLALTVRHWRNAQRAPLVLGIAGAQGSGKSTLARLLGIILEQGFGFRVARLSLDDLYLTRQRREELARTAHPLLVTRGVPGTHDVQLGIDVLQHLRMLGAGHSMRLPRFDKARDDRLPIDQWESVSGPLDVILFEGWCLSARPQPEYALKIAVNSLEEFEDAELRWREFVNRHLQGDYAELFAQLDRLLFLTAPSWQCVLDWRGRQERELAETTPEGEGARIMNGEQLKRFVQHYERLTRLMLATTPNYADLSVELGLKHEILSLRHNPR